MILAKMTITEVKIDKTIMAVGLDLVRLETGGLRKRKTIEFIN